MRKDYMPIRAEQTGLDEMGLVEQRWTAIWQQTEEAPARLAARVKEREEYHLMAPYLTQILAAGGRILDGGCGLGEWTIFLSQQGYDVYGVDISRQTIDQLTARFPQHHFAYADIRYLDFPDGFFDAYFSWGVFEHFEEGLNKCITEAWRVLRLEGYLFVSVPFQNWRHILRDARPVHLWDDKAHYDPKRGYTLSMRFYQWRLTAPELERELAMRGFRVLRVRPIHLQEGLHRALSLDLHLTPGSRTYAVAERLLRRIMPADWLCHMLIAVAEKIERVPGQMNSQG